MSASKILPGVSIESLKKAVLDIASSATKSVEAVRSSFTTGIVPVQTVGSGSVSDYITRLASESGSAIIKSTKRLGVSTSVAGSVKTPQKPELDFIEIDTDKNVGMLDSFFARIVISVENSFVDKNRVIKIFRCNNGKINAVNPSVSALTDIVASSQTKKSLDPIALSIFNASEIGVGNKTTNFISNDVFSNQRYVVSSGTLKQPFKTLNTNRIGSPTQASLISIDGANRNVLENTSFFVSVRPTLQKQRLQIPLTVGKVQGINVLKGSSVATSTAGIVEVGNSLQFKEIASISTLKSKQVGDFNEIEYIDPTVIYGCSYSYYAICVDENNIESQRSRIVKIDVNKQVVPQRPNVLYSIIANKPRFSIQCTGSFIDHVEIFRHGGKFPKDIQLLGSDNSIITNSSPSSTKTGFFHIADVATNADKSTTFTDVDVLPGQKLEYRIYAVDSFGMKSQTPFSCSISMPSHGKNVIELPSITAEQSIGEKNVKISVTCDSNFVKKLLIDRKELNSLSGFKSPATPSYFSFGKTTVKKANSRFGPHLNDFSNKNWQGILTPEDNNSTMYDTTVSYDMIYQYGVRTVDLKGNIGPRVLSQPIKVSVKNVIDSISFVTSSIVHDEIGSPLGVLLSWESNTNDFSPTDLVGNQSVLSDSSVRNVYQVERRKIGSISWDVMPATTSSYFFDNISNKQAPSYRPKYANIETEYDYRVTAMQSGGFLSNYTKPIRAATTPLVTPPDVVWTRSTSISARPISIVVSWNSDEEIIDGWEIERAAVNKIFSSKIFSIDDSQVRQLDYKNVASIKRESSRALSVSAKNLFDKKIFVGNRFFIDQDVNLSNSYYYRVRSVLRSGKASEWIYSGISLSDSPFDRKFLSTLSDDEKIMLSNNKTYISGLKIK